MAPSTTSRPISTAFWFLYFPYRPLLPQFIWPWTRNKWVFLHIWRFYFAEAAGWRHWVLGCHLFLMSLSPQSCPCKGLSSFLSLGWVSVLDKGLAAVCWWKCEKKVFVTLLSHSLWQIHSLESFFLHVRFYSWLSFLVLLTYWSKFEGELHPQMSEVSGFQMLSSHSQHIDVCKRTSRFL